MRFQSWENYIDAMLGEVKFRFDHREIRAEYEEHMEDKLEFLMDCGMDEESAAREVLAEMGEPRSLGKALNSIHNPLLGWVWLLITRMAALAAAAFIILMMWSIIIPDLYSTITGQPLNRGQERTLIEKHGEIIFQHEIDEKYELDKSWLRIKEIRRYEDGTVLVEYSQNGRLAGGRTGGGNINLTRFIHDDKGNLPGETRGVGTGGALIRRSYAEIDGVPEDAEYIVMDYKAISGQVYIKMPLCEEAVQQ